MSDLPFSPAADRNKEPILSCLRELLPEAARVLEVASGTGQHVVHFAAALPATRWQPSDPESEARRAITARLESLSLTNVSAPIELDVTGAWPVLSADALYTANMLHISEPETVAGLMQGAASVLGHDGRLLIYGPFKRGGVQVSPSNEAFDQSLRARNPRWGIRDLEEVASVAEQAGFELSKVIDMPANNFLLSFERNAQ